MGRLDEGQGIAVGMGSTLLEEPLLLGGLFLVLVVMGLGLMSLTTSLNASKSLGGA